MTDFIEKGKLIGMVHVFLDGSTMEFTQGKFDSYCVKYTHTDGKVIFPRDAVYLDHLLKIGAEYNCDRVYSDFCMFYPWISTRIEDTVRYPIRTLSYSYTDKETFVEKLFMMFYYGMVAEENKAGTSLGKRIKRLAVHQVLIHHMEPKDVARFSKGIPAWKLDMICKGFGF